MPYSVYRTLYTYRVERIGNNMVLPYRNAEFYNLGRRCDRGL